MRPRPSYRGLRVPRRFTSTSPLRSSGCVHVLGSASSPSQSSSSMPRSARPAAQSHPSIVGALLIGAVSLDASAPPHSLCPAAELAEGGSRPTCRRSVGRTPAPSTPDVRSLACLDLRAKGRFGCLPAFRAAGARSTVAVMSDRAYASSVAECFLARRARRRCASPRCTYQRLSRRRRSLSRLDPHASTLTERVAWSGRDGCDQAPSSRAKLRSFCAVSMFCVDADRLSCGAV
jgi:hypothetical protein